MNKTHWNTVKVDGDVNGRMMQELIDHSYELIVSSLPKREREKLC
jgi:predicted DNA-binding protein (MmcQ/YjbR family)